MFKNVPYIKESTRDGFIVQFETFMNYLATPLANFYENIYIKTDTYWDATIFPLYMEEKVKDRLNKDEHWKTSDSYHFVRVTYKEREEFTFLENKWMY